MFIICFVRKIYRNTVWTISSILKFIADGKPPIDCKISGCRQNVNIAYDNVVVYVNKCVDCGGYDVGWFTKNEIGDSSKRLDEKGLNKLRSQFIKKL